MKRTDFLSQNCIIVRDSTEPDMPTIHNIHAHEVLHGLATFDEVPPSQDEMLTRRKRVLSPGLPYLSAECKSRVVRYSYATPYRLRSAYRSTIEDSVYVAEGMQGRGVGRALLAALIVCCETGPWRQMVAVIGGSGNAGFKALHKRLGIRRVGTLDGVGVKLGRSIDIVLMQRVLGVDHEVLSDIRTRINADARFAPERPLRRRIAGGSPVRSF